VKERAQFNFLSLVESALRGYGQTAEGRPAKSMTDLAPFFRVSGRRRAAGPLRTHGSARRAGLGAGAQRRYGTGVAIGDGKRMRGADRGGAIALERRGKAGGRANGRAHGRAGNFQNEHGGAPPKTTEELRPYVKNPEALKRFRPQAGESEGDGGDGETRRDRGRRSEIEKKGTCGLALRRRIWLCGSCTKTPVGDAALPRRRARVRGPKKGGPGEGPP